MRIVGRSDHVMPRLVLALLESRHWDGAAELARWVDATPATVTPWVQLLEFHRVLMPDRPKGFRVDLEALLDFLVAQRMVSFRPAPAVAIALDGAGLHAALKEVGAKHVFGMFTAANFWAPLERRLDVHVYLARTDMSRLRRIVTQNPPDPSVRLYRLFPYGEKLRNLIVQERDGMPVTSAFQTLVDLLAHPDGGPHAAYLQSQMLPRFAARTR